ncbi:triose-phosphate isomerase [Proteiniborus sp. MB09-C3]|uniref:triose-phosphate isomerase n=1 Tax=Proteiniborus sp. MB09-C3 TaxID=3050072 RepID=UPI002556A688|nr:triose-phosphate isomerase [Proteiniborus sp. MB09-C3]WIV10387.1 triose-phosphate isomerase [Proteiniborus sp. MB09-C3]
MRIPIIAGNWKMNKTIEEAIQLVKEIKSNLKDGVETVVCVPFTALSEVKKEISGTKLKLGAQNMHWEESGAFTGEISPLMLKEIGVDFCIIGHSERRQYFGETDEMVNRKIKSALKHGISPIVCVGETLEQREANIEKKVVETQILKAFDGIVAEEVEKIVIAYEPIWAIGTGKTATKEEANEIIAFIRKIIMNKYQQEISDKVRIQYGGSVKPDNITDIMNQSDIDGALVGGASLKPEEFIKLVSF